MNNDLSKNVNTLPNGCRLCGCTDIHACPREIIYPWTEEKIKELEAILDKYESEE